MQFPLSILVTPEWMETFRRSLFVPVFWNIFFLLFQFFRSYIQPLNHFINWLFYRWKDEILLCFYMYLSPFCLSPFVEENFFSSKEMFLKPCSKIKVAPWKPERTRAISKAIACSFTLMASHCSWRQWLHIILLNKEKPN